MVHRLPLFGAALAALAACVVACSSGDGSSSAASSAVGGSDGGDEGAAGPDGPAGKGDAGPGDAGPDGPPPKGGSAQLVLESYSGIYARFTLDAAGNTIVSGESHGGGEVVVVENAKKLAAAGPFLAGFTPAGKLLFAHSFAFQSMWTVDWARSEIVVVGPLGPNGLFFDGAKIVDLGPGASYGIAFARLDLTTGAVHATKVWPTTKWVPIEAVAVGPGPTYAFATNAEQPQTVDVGLGPIARHAVVVLGADGTPSAQTTFDGPAETHVRTMAIGADGTIYGGGDGCAATIGPLSLTCTGTSRPLLFAIDATTHAVPWAKAFGISNGDVSQLVVGADGNVAMLGRTRGPIDLGAGLLPALGAGTRLFVASFTPSGAHRWSTPIVGGSTSTSEVIGQIDATGGELHVTAQAAGGFVQGDPTVKSAWFGAARTYSLDGVVKSTKVQAGWPKTSYVYASPSPQGDVAVGAVTSGATDLGFGPLAPSAGHNAGVVIGRLSP